MKKRKRAYLDTNVLVEYAWERTPSPPASHKKLATRLIELGMDGTFDIYISTFCIMELFEHFRDWYLMKKVIEDGFGYREFRSERRNHRLTKEDIDKLEALISDFKDKPNIYYVDFDTVPEDFHSRVTILQKNGFDCLDAFHLLIALDIGATHFITKDGEVRARFDKATRREITSPPINMTNIRGFLKGLNKSN